MPLQTETIKREEFTWLFSASFEDGHSIIQEQDDKCYSRADGSGSTFTDVLAYAKTSKLISFNLEHIEENLSVSVDLTDGTFLVNGVDISLHNQYFQPENYPLELVYFRETRVEQVVDKEGAVVGARHFTSRYFIGWKTQVNGKLKQVTIAVA